MGCMNIASVNLNLLLAFEALFEERKRQPRPNRPQPAPLE